MPRVKRNSGIFAKWSNLDRQAKEHFFSIILLILGLFALFSAFGLGGRVGVVVKDALFSVLGITFYLLGPILLTLTYGVFLKKSFSSRSTFFIGLVLFLIFFPTFCVLSFSEEAGGVVGQFSYNIIENLFDVFSWVIIPIVALTSILLATRFNPLRILHWALEPRDEEEEDRDELDFEEEEEDRDELDFEEEEEEYEEEEEDVEVEEDEEEEEVEEEKPKEKTIKPYQKPQIAILSSEKSVGRSDNTKRNADTIQRTMGNFNIQVTIEEVIVGPTFTRYSLRPAEGVRLSKIVGLQNNLELALAAHPIRIEAPIPGESLVGIEVPNTARAIVGLRSLLGSKDFIQSQVQLPLVLGRTISGSVFIKGLAKMPHILVAGTTGSGKSVLIHNLICSLIYTYGPESLRFIFIDPKRVELTLYDGIPHLLTKPITDPKKALQALAWTTQEMERRYELLEEHKARDVLSFNKVAKRKGITPLPYIVVVIDELADLMHNFPREIEGSIVRIAQKSRAVGIHLILSTQRPSVNVITGLIKANIPVRVALQVASQIDSRTILDTPGAETLTGNGDLLYLSAENKKPIRAQSGFVSEEEVKRVVKQIVQKNGIADEFIEFSKKNTIASGSSSEEDELFEEAKSIVIDSKKASTSLLQRKLKVGYARAARLIDELEEQGIVGPQVGSRPREILVETEEG